MSKCNNRLSVSTCHHAILPQAQCLPPSACSRMLPQEVEQQLHPFPAPAHMTESPTSHPALPACPAVLLTGLEERPLKPSATAIPQQTQPTSVMRAPLCRAACMAAKKSAAAAASPTTAPAALLLRHTTALAPASLRKASSKGCGSGHVLTTICCSSSLPRPLTCGSPTQCTH